MKRKPSPKRPAAKPAAKKKPAAKRKPAAKKKPAAKRKPAKNGATKKARPMKLGEQKLSSGSDGKIYVITRVQ